MFSALTFRTTANVATPATMGGTEPPIGTIAHLAGTYQADRGVAVAPRTVDRFKKFSNGRWGSYPGNDVSFATLGDLHNAAPVAWLEPPATAAQFPSAEPVDAAEQAGEKRTQDMPHDPAQAARDAAQAAGYAIEDEAPPAKPFPVVPVAVAAVAVLIAGFLFTRK